MNTIAGAYSNEAVNKFYDLIFCDQLTQYRPIDKLLSLYPWKILFSKNPSAAELEVLVADKNLESRLQLLAYRELSKFGVPAKRKELMGVVIEVGLDGGLDTLAAYRDGTARYINHSEKIIIWDSRTSVSDRLIEQLFEESQKVLQHIGPWTGARLAPPTLGDVRLSFLVSDGLYFGQGPFDALAADVMGGPVINAATQLMSYLTSHNKS
ncbi:MAG: hypothetical protein H7Y31_13195 [Chitinophagaceae bacterium]|nr:hypothetical protein [Chitinophagaceae bacterium]